MNGERELSERLKKVLLEGGADLVSFADIGEFPEESRKSMPRAVSLVVALNPEVLRGIEGGPTRHYFREYENVNGRIEGLCRLAGAFLEERGFRAVVLSPTTEQWNRETFSAGFSHKAAATRAGLGWIGKSDLLVTTRYGAAVRLGTVLTDGPLAPERPVDQSRCGRCTACTERCPAGAIGESNWEKGVPRERLFDPSRCAVQARRFCAALDIPSTICGICIVACPWTAKYVNRGKTTPSP
jgi:epoxyqueuosine reductase QueG